MKFCPNCGQRSNMRCARCLRDGRIPPIERRQSGITSEYLYERRATLVNYYNKFAVVISDSTLKHLEMLPKCDRVVMV
jgi:hypothetical protein